MAMMTRDDAGSPIAMDPEELAEWLDSVDELTATRGPREAEGVLRAVLGRAQRLGLALPPALVSDHVNTIPASEEPAFPGDEALEARIRHYVRWNAAVMVARANRRFDGLGGHLATYASRRGDAAWTCRGPACSEGTSSRKPLPATGSTSTRPIRA